MKLCLVLSVCLALLIRVEGQQTEDNRDNGQGGCQPPFCFNFDHIFDPIGKKIGKINTIIGFKTNKINKVIGFKNAIKNFKNQKIQFEIDAIRSAQSVLDAKLQAKTAAKAGLKSLDNISNGIGSVFRTFFPPQQPQPQPAPQRQDRGARVRGSFRFRG